MGPSFAGNLDSSWLISLLLGLVLVLVTWIFNREINRVNKRVDLNDERDNAQDKLLSNHSQRLAINDGNTDRQ